jgi:lysophospholipase
MPGDPVPAGAETVWAVAADGVRIRTAIWPATAAAPKGTIILLHGRAEVIEKYFEVVQELRDRGYAVATLDWRGQGGSDRFLRLARNGHVERFLDYDRDADALIALAAQRGLPHPFFALGHSMGGLITLRVARRGAPLRRIVVTAPMLALAGRAASSLRSVRTLSALASFFGVSDRAVPGVDRRCPDIRPFAGNALTSDPGRYARFAGFLRAHPDLAIGAPTFGWLYTAAVAMREAATPAFATGIRQPVLLVGAGSDGVVSTAAVAAMAKRLEGGSFVVIEGSRHEPMMEQDSIREQFWAAFDAFVPGISDSAGKQPEQFAV